jgi:hypothetical protein
MERGGKLMLEFQMFRIKVYPSKQAFLFEHHKTPSEILKDVILSLPSAELRKGMIWHIGNVSILEEGGLYFRIGRTTKSTLEIYKNGNFEEQEFETAPYTHVVLDIRLEVCVIAKKSKLSPKTTGIANQFVRLLNESTRARQIKANFEIDEINDPTDFITHLRQAFSVSKFWVTFSRPNAFDVNEDFIKPMEKLLKDSEGEKGKTELEGDNLNPESLEDIARSAASTGNDATAWLQPSETSRKIRKRLKGNPVIVMQEDVADPEHKMKILQLIRENYKRVKGTIDTE